MFVKINKLKQYEYIKIVESYRDENGVPRHRVILNLGRLDHLKNNPSFIKVLEQIQEIIGMRTTVDLEGISETVIINWDHMIYKKLWELYSLPELLKNIQNKTNHQFDLHDNCYLTALEHLLSPQSKLGMYHCQDRYFGQSPISLPKKCI